MIILNSECQEVVIEFAKDEKRFIEVCFKDLAEKFVN